jgi:hypothetical protein
MKLLSGYCNEKKLDGGAFRKIQTGANEFTLRELIIFQDFG